MSAAGYAGTLLRYACLASALVLAMALLHRLLRRVGCRDEAAAGWAFLLPWLAGLAVFWLLPSIQNIHLEPIQQ